MWVLIIAKPGRLRDGLLALLSAFPEMGAVDAVEDGSTALQKAHDLPPSLVFVDSSLPFNQVLETVRLMKQAWPRTHCVVIAEKIQQFQPAQEAGSDDVLLKGFRTSELFKILQRCFASKSP